MVATKKVEQGNFHTDQAVAAGKAASDFPESSAVPEKMAIVEEHFGMGFGSSTVAGFEELEQQTQPCPQYPKYQQAPLRLLEGFAHQTSCSILVVAVDEGKRSSTMAGKQAAASFLDCLETTRER